MLYAGIGIGLLIAILIVLVEIYLDIRKKTILTRVGEKIQEQIKQQVQIFDLPPESTRALNETFRRNDERGVDSKLNDILDDSE